MKRVLCNLLVAALLSVGITNVAPHAARADDPLTVETVIELFWIASQAVVPEIEPEGTCPACDQLATQIANEVVYNNLAITTALTAWITDIVGISTETLTLGEWDSDLNDMIELSPASSSRDADIYNLDFFRGCRAGGGSVSACRQGAKDYANSL